MRLNRAGSKLCADDDYSDGVPMPHIMKRPLRKLAGIIALLLLIVVYCLLVMVFATTTLPSAGGIITPIFYAIAGLAWVPLAIVILKWAYAPDRS